MNTKEHPNIQRIDGGEKRVPLEDLSDFEYEIAWLGCVLSKYIAEKDFDEHFFYTRNPEKKPEYETPLPPIERPTRHPLQGEFVLVRPWDNKLLTRVV